MKMPVEWDRITLEKGEAKTLFDSWEINGSSKKWLDMALRKTIKTYGIGSDLRVKSYMRQMWKEQNDLLRN